MPPLALNSGSFRFTFTAEIHGTADLLRIEVESPRMIRSRPPPTGATPPSLNRRPASRKSKRASIHFGHPRLGEKPEKICSGRPAPRLGETHTIIEKTPLQSIP